MDKKRFCCAIELLADVSCYSALAFASRLDWKHIYSSCSECSGQWPTASKLVHGEDSVQGKLQALEAGVNEERGDTAVRAVFAERYHKPKPRDSHSRKALRLRIKSPTDRIRRSACIDSLESRFLASGNPASAPDRYYQYINGLRSKV